MPKTAALNNLNTDLLGYAIFDTSYTSVVDDSFFFSRFVSLRVHDDALCVYFPCRNNHVSLCVCVCVLVNLAIVTLNW